MKTFMFLSDLDKLADDVLARPIMKQLLEWFTAAGENMLFTTLVAVIALCLMIPFTRMYGVIGAVITLYFYPSCTLTLLGAITLGVIAFIYWRKIACLKTTYLTLWR